MNTPVTIDLVVYIAASVSVAVGIVVWVTTRIGQVRTSLDAHKLHAAETYATKLSVSDGFTRIENKMDKMADKLDHLLLNKRDTA